MCSVNNCKRDIWAKGYCSAHLSRKKRGSSLDTPIKERKTKHSPTCGVINCNRSYLARGFCSVHLKRIKAGRDIFAPVRATNRPVIKRNCPTCNKSFSVSACRGFIKTCSRSCGQGSKSGEKNSNWKGGLTATNIKERNRFAREIRDLVFRRDDYTCQICETKDSGNLQVDHIKRWAEYPEFRFELDNCRTVCRPCHYYLTLKRKMPSSSKWGLPNRRLIKDLT